jgi:hypothetical protein
MPHLQSAHEGAVYRWCRGSSTLLVDNLVITDTKEEEVEAVKAEMKVVFQMSDLGILSYLEIEIHQDDSDISLRQTSYARCIVDLGGLTVAIHPKLQWREG